MMGTYKIDDIRQFIADKTGTDINEVITDCNIDPDLGCTGDDFHALMQAYASAFNVDMSRYLWYFHTEEEGQNIGAIFVKAPNSRVEHIPVTPRLLVDFANKGRWDIDYPPHKLPERRYDLLINQLLVGLLSCLLIYSCTC